MPVSTAVTITLAPLMPGGAAYADQEWSATFTNLTVSDPSGHRALKVAGPNSVRIEEARLRRNRVMESPGSFLRKTSDAWEKQNDTKRIDEITIESLARGRTSGFLETNHSTCRYDICARGEQAVEHSYISNKSQAFTETHVGSLLRHLGDEFRRGVDQTLRENAESIYKAGALPTRALV